MHLAPCRKSGAVGAVVTLVVITRHDVFQQAVILFVAARHQRQHRGTMGVDVFLKLSIALVFLNQEITELDHQLVGTRAVVWPCRGKPADRFDLHGHHLFVLLLPTRPDDQIQLPILALAVLDECRHTGHRAVPGRPAPAAASERMWDLHLRAVRTDDDVVDLNQTRGGGFFENVSDREVFRMFVGDLRADSCRPHIHEPTRAQRLGKLRVMVSTQFQSPWPTIALFIDGQCRHGGVEPNEAPDTGQVFEASFHGVNGLVVILNIATERHTYLAWRLLQIFKSG